MREARCVPWGHRAGIDASWDRPALRVCSFLFFFNDTATTEIYTLSLHDALPISRGCDGHAGAPQLRSIQGRRAGRDRSEEHTSELQSRLHLVCRLLLEKKKRPSCATRPSSTQLPSISLA